MLLTDEWAEMQQSGCRSNAKAVSVWHKWEIIKQYDTSVKVITAKKKSYPHTWSSKDSL